MMYLKAQFWVPMLINYFIKDIIDIFYFIGNYVVVSYADDNTEYMMVYKICVKHWDTGIRY